MLSLNHCESPFCRMIDCGEETLLTQILLANIVVVDLNCK